MAPFVRREAACPPFLILIWKGEKANILAAVWGVTGPTIWDHQWGSIPPEFSQ